MFRVLSLTTLLCALTFTVCTRPDTVVANDASADLQWSVRRMNTWLGSGSRAIGWRKFLLLNALETQAAKGPQADVQILHECLDRFCSAAGGLDHPAFVDVRIAIEQQIRNLSRTPYGDASSVLLDQYNRYCPVTFEKMAYHRERAIYDLTIMKRYFRRTLYSRDRANLFYDIQLDSMLEFLEQVAFELAPEVSLGKISSMIKDKKADLREVTLEIDAMPADELDEDGADDANEAPLPDADEPVDLNAPLVPSSIEDSPAVLLEVPMPDDSTPLQVLEQRRDRLQATIEELTAKRTEVLKVDRPRLTRRRDNLRQMKRFSDGLEQVAKQQFDPYFTTARRSFEQFIQIYASGTADNLQENMLIRLQVLSKEIPALGNPNERRSAGRVGSLLQWFEKAGQAAPLVTAIRRDYSLPNVYLNISSGLINSIANQSDTETRVIDENISGRLMRGYATTNTNVSLDLQDDPNQANISIRLLGSIASSTRFREGKWYGSVSAAGQFEGRRNLYANIGGLFAGDSRVNANLAAEFGGLTTRSNLIQRIAFKQFYKDKAKNDADAAADAEAEVYERFDRLTDEAVESGQDTLFELNDRAIDYASWIPDFYLRSSSNFIEAIGKKDSIGTLAAPDYPQATTVPADVIIRVHDSLLSNFVDPIFAGKTFTNEELAAEAADLLGKTPEGLATEDGDGAADDESFSITFDNVRPIQFEFDGDMVTVSVSGKKFGQDERVINAGLQIRLRFKIRRSAAGLQLVRDGDAVIELTEPEKKDAKIVAFKSFLEDKLNSDEAAAETNAIDLPENLLPIDDVEALRDSDIARSLQLVQCKSNAGWLSLAWRHAPDAWSVATDLSAIWPEEFVAPAQVIELQEAK